MHEPTEEAEYSMASFMDEKVDRIDDPDEYRHAVPTVRRLIVSCKVQGIVPENEEDDEFEDDQGSFHSKSFLQESLKSEGEWLCEGREHRKESQFAELRTATFSEFSHLSIQRLIVTVGVLN
jgi:hypothetical protein